MTDQLGSSVWPLWQRVLFRFFFVYLLLQMRPWAPFAAIPGISQLDGWYENLVDWAVRASNARIFHVRETLVAANGSGDTSWAWVQLWLLLSVAAIAGIAWSVLDRRRTSYPRLAYWLRTFTRYYIALFALSYGIIKIFALQMVFPSLSNLSTTFGDLLPMRLSWLFIGYSTRYQVFSGVMETVAGLLLLNRKTVTLGLFAATGAFLNVVMINLSYDVPVKLFALHLLFACVFLLVLDAKRLFSFLVMNQAAPSTQSYEPYFGATWQRRTRLAVKGYVIVMILALPFYRSWQSYRSQKNPVVGVPFRRGIYDVQRFVLNGDTVPALVGDTVRWRDVIFDNATGGSVGTTDTLFWQRYRRGYFRYKADTATRTVAFWKTSFRLDSTGLFRMRYEMPDTNTIRFWTMIRKDSLFVEAVRSRRQFQLAERQFHWLSEYNR